MFGDGALTLREFAMREQHPLATIHEAILEFLRNRDDAVLFGAQAVNAYVDDPRMTQDVDILSTRAAELAEELRAHLANTFMIAVRVREVAAGRGFRIYQLRQPRNRDLADIRSVTAFPPTTVIADVRVPTVEELIAQKVISAGMRSAQPKGDTDRRDVKVLLLAHPELKADEGPVLARLVAAGATESIVNEWRRIVAMHIQAPGEDDEFAG